ncbi:MAG: nickel-type superoxide dismutase maturation protease [Candidatus Thermoplasmatota archaeon]|nr:nickel-type superoxide dismutase maturation protease [Candidatus Thermoplasmatota archaeon]
MAVVVNGDSMWPTLKEGDTIHVDVHSNQSLQPGDIVVFPDPRDASRMCIKRLKRIEENGLFVEGDNPDPTASTDSHNYGLIPLESVIGFKR